MDTLDISIVDGDANQGRYDALSAGMDDMLGVTGKRVEGCISHDIAVPDNSQAICIVAAVVNQLQHLCQEL